MIWSLDTDDFRGEFCDRGNKYPLLTQIYNVLFSCSDKKNAP